MTTVCKFDDLVDGAAACHVIDGVAVAVVESATMCTQLTMCAAMPMCRCQKETSGPMRARLNAQNTEVRSV